MEKVTRTLKAKWPFFLIYLVILFVSLGAIYSALPSDYLAKMKIFSTPSSNSALANIYDAPYADRAVKTVSVLISGDATINDIATNTGLDPNEIRASYSTRNIPGTQVIEITIKNRVARNVTLIAQSLPASIDGMLKTIQADTEERNQIRVSVAEEPGQPVADNSDKTKTVGLILLLGIGLGYLLIFILDPADSIFKRILEAEKTNDKVLGKFTHMDEVGNNFDKILSHKDSLLAEALREIRTNIIFDDKNSTNLTIAISSPSGNEGKTSFASALGIILGEASKRVVVIDADIKKTNNINKGLADYFNGNENNEELIHKTNIANLWYMPSGNSGNSHLSTLFGKRDFADLRKWLFEKSKMDYVLIDSPSVNSPSDIAVIAKNSDGVIIVTEHGKTLKKDYEETKRVLDKANAKIFGIVISKFKPRRSAKS